VLREGLSKAFGEFEGALPPATESLWRSTLAKVDLVLSVEEQHGCPTCGAEDCFHGDRELMIECEAEMKANEQAAVLALRIAKARSGTCPDCGSAVTIDPHCQIVNTNKDGDDYNTHYAPAALCSGCEFAIELPKEN